MPLVLMFTAHCPLMSRCRSFTLIELLIVVAIVAVLAAIGTSNFIEAQTRGKVARAKADLRSQAAAIENYAVDWSMYPPNGVIYKDGSAEFSQSTLSKSPAHKFANSWLTSPVGYITQLPSDIFAPLNLNAFPESRIEMERYFYTNMRWQKYLLAPGAQSTILEQKTRQWGDWILASGGPDLDRLDLAADLQYDATNGIISDGDIIRGQSAW